MTQLSVDFIIPTLNINPGDVTTCKNSIISQIGAFEKKINIEEGSSFTKGVNEGIRKGKSPYIAIINDDVKLEDTWLQEAYQVLVQNPNCSAVATRVLSYDGKYIDSCGMNIKIEGKAINRGNGEKEDKNKFYKTEEVFGIPCSAALFRREALEEIKLFDEDFISYEEDVDISFRLRLAGFTIFYTPHAIAFHKMYATSSSLGNLKVRMDSKNWIYIIIKNYPLNLLFKFGPQLILERLKNLSGLIKQTLHLYYWKSLWMIPYSLLMSYGEVIIKFPKMLKKRREIQSIKAYNNLKLIYWISKYE